MMKYLTFFDRNYVARGVVMIDSLLALAPAAEILVFALDAQTEAILDQYYGPDICILSPDYLANRWPELESKKHSQRTRWERIAIHKPCLMSSVLEEKLAKDDLLFYVDADTQFFQNPELALAPMTGASIGINPHNFPAEHVDLIKYGKFNAGFMVIRCDKAGRKCMQDWVEDCFKWCRAETIDGKFMNQGYLNSWPSRFPGVVLLEHPGLNLAPWNVSGLTLSIEGGAKHVNGSPLIFYHFHDMQRMSGRWKNVCLLVSPDAHASLFQTIYEPYSDLLEEAEDSLASMGYDTAVIPKGKFAPSV